MIEIYPNLFIGDAPDYELSVKGRPGWCVVQACKEPYHREALGYTGRGAPKDHPEYFMARRDNRLILNLVDAPDPSFFSKQIIDTALEFIHVALSSRNRVLVHCNQGESRAPGIGLLYLAKYTDKLNPDLSQAISDYRQVCYFFRPSLGMSGFITQNWKAYSRKSP